MPISEAVLLTRGALFLALLLTLAACDTGGGPASLDDAPPVVSDLSYSPDSIDLAEMPDDQVDGDVVEVTMNLSARVTDPDGDLARVTYVVQSPVRNTEPLAEGELTAADGRYARMVTFDAPRGLTGLYTVRVYAYDEAGRLSNEVRGSLRITGRGEPPVITEVSANTPFTPPGELRFVASVSDPDGLVNVARVEILTPAGDRLTLYDDGTRGGDATAGDGRYTATFTVDEAEPGTFVFSFQATDRSGLQSDVFEKEVVIES